MTSVVWFRRDARLDDNPALAEAARGGVVIPLFVIDPALYDRCSPPRRELLVAGLAELDRRISDHGGRLRVEHGDPTEIVPAVAAEVAADEVHINAEVTPYGRERDRLVAGRCLLRCHDGVYACPPGTVLTNDGDHYRVFTPFFKRWSEYLVEPVAQPSVDFSHDPGQGLPRLPLPDLAAGESGAETRVEEFLDRVDRYIDERDRIDLDSTSHLSVDLKYGWVGPRRLISAVRRAPASSSFIRQVAWRDFYGHLLAEHPDLVDTSFDHRFRDLAWRNDPAEIEAWKLGRTGFPLVDAAMRQLVAEGRMHNRARMIVASFLVKDLLVDWRVGERFFRHHLIDGDIAQNAGNWQWVAGTGTDAAPYFRVFNPVTQSKRFDPKGSFIRRWVPELAELPNDTIHSPWETGPLELAGYGVELGQTYPDPIVDHAMARERAIEAYNSARGSR